jgi:hypothetical protein
MEIRLIRWIHGGTGYYPVLQFIDLGDSISRESLPPPALPIYSESALPPEEFCA